ncbi:hypothetical protein TKK_0001648 [Trichogramma kaykai]
MKRRRREDYSEDETASYSSSYSSSSETSPERSRKRRYKSSKHGSSKRERHVSRRRHRHDGSRSHDLAERRRHTRSRSRSPSDSSQSSRGSEKPNVSKRKGPQNVDDIKLIAEANEIALSEELLQAMGKKVHEERTLAPPLRSEFMSRWQNSIKQGLPEAE